MKLISAILCLAIIVMALPAWAQTKDEGKAEPIEKSGGPVDKDDTAQLAKAAQNPIADMVSLPLQVNLNFRYGPSKDKNLTVTNFQPVIPISLGKDWNLITRTIVPFTCTEYPAYQTGIGNVQFTGFLSPHQFEQICLGCRPGLSVSHPYRHLPGQPDVERGSVGGGGLYERAVGRGSFGPECLVLCRSEWQG